jgi:GNAT superfamily N-acetyltransferase
VTRLSETSTENAQPPLSSVELLDKSHEITQFDCGKHPSLTQWLKRFALNQASGDTRTYVVHRSKRVVGYCSLAPGSIAKANATARASKSAPDPIPVVLLARLAVDISEQGKGLGSALLKDALLRGIAGADILGGRAILVHAIDSGAAKFYARFGFESCPVSDLHLLLLIKDVRLSLGL